MRLALSLLTLMLLTAPTLAQEAAPAEPVAPTSCETLFDFIRFAEKGPQTTIETTEDGCRVTDFFAGSTKYDRFRIGSLTLSAPGLFEALADGLPPPAASVALTGVASAPRVDDPLFEYILELQSAPFDVTLSYHWDAAAGALIIDEASLSSPTLGRLALSGRLAGIEADTLALAESGRLPPVALYEAALTLDNKAFVPSFIAPYLVSLLSRDEDPRLQVARYQQLFDATLQGLPDTLIDADSKAVLSNFIASFPHPTGVHTIHLQSAQGIGLETLLSNKALELLTRPGMLAVTASHTE